MAPARQRMKKYRENMTEEKKAEVKKKDAERKRYLRKNFKLTASQKATMREKTRIRVQKHRLNKKANNLTDFHTRNGSDVRSQTPVKAYKSPQTLGKAVRKVKKALPCSPRKKKQIIELIAKEYGMVKTAIVERPTCKISEETTNIVTEFYNRDDISRLMPGKNYNMCYKNSEGIKIQCQKRILMYTLKEAYVLFGKDNPEISISWGKFCELRPKFVVSVTKKCQEVCCCPYCDNFHLLLQILHQWRSDIPLSISSVVEGTVCDSKQSSCMKGRCDACKTGIDEVVKIYTDIKDDKNANRVGTFTVNQWNGGELAEKTYNIKEMQKELKTQLGTLRSHRYNITRQTEELKKAKENLKHNQIILLIDFAENFSIKHHREVMAAHWVNNKQVTIFTGVVYFINNDGKLDQKSYAIISDTKHHGTTEVFAFMHPILSDVKEFVKDLRFVSYWSDGAAQHFKNRYNISNLTFHQSDFGVAAEWNYQESYHGKGPHDGVGAAMKRIVWNTILRKQATVCSAKDFYDIVSNSSQSTFCAYVPITEINQLYQDILKSRWIETKKAVGIQAARCIKPTQENIVTMFENSGDTDGKLVRFAANTSYESNDNDSEASMEIGGSITHFQDKETKSILLKTSDTSIQASSSDCTNINIEDYIVVNFNGEKYPGHVQKIDSTGEIFCSVLHRSGKNWKWPEKPDIEWYKPDEVVCKINAPVPVSARGLFAFHADEI